MTPRLCIALALCLILQSIPGVLLQDPSEFGGGGNDAFSDEYITPVPTVGESDMAEEAVDDRPADGSLADGSMMFSGLDNSQTTISVPTLEDNGGDEHADSSDTSSTVTLSPMLRSDDSLDSTVQEDASENLPTASPEHTIDPSWLRGEESPSVSDTIAVPVSNSTDIASAEANSTDVTNTDNDATAINSTEANSTDITNTDINGAVSTSAETNSTEVPSTEANSTEAITPPSESDSSDVTNPLTPGPTNPPGVNDTTVSLNSVTENLPENKTAENVPGPTEENSPNTTAENIPEPDNTPEPTAETIPETTAETIPETTAENIPETTAENIPDPTTENNSEDDPNYTIPPSADDTAAAKAAAAGNADQGSDTGTQNNVNSKAWGVILGIAVTVGVVGLIIYVMQKRKQHRNFSHSKLVEEAHPDPVLRLDNSEPLDLKYDGFGYYNPGLQGDSIQMSNYPSGHSH